jgi:NADH:ubiquinone oxidoreductase subunit 6 (subunit J)
VPSINGKTATLVVFSATITSGEHKGEKYNMTQLLDEVSPPVPKQVQSGDKILVAYTEKENEDSAISGWSYAGVNHSYGIIILAAAFFLLILIIGRAKGVSTIVALLVTMAVYRTPAVAYMPDVTPKPLRSKANAIINLVGYLGGIFTTVVMMFMLKSEKQTDGSSSYTDDQSFLPVFIIIAAFMLVAVLVQTFSIRETKLPHVKDEPQEVQQGGKMAKPVFRSLVLILASVFLWFMAYNAVTTAFSRYCVNVWGTDLGTSSSYLLTATVAAIAAFIPLGMLSSKVG